MTLSVGDTVTWSWGNGEAAGKVVELFEDDVTRTIKGSEVKRRASEKVPAALIEQAGGDRVLKSVTELTEP